LLAAAVAEGGVLVCGFDTLGDGRGTDGVREADDAAADGGCIVTSPVRL